MKTLVDHLSQYANYHRDPRNIATHFVGIPMIVLAVTILLSRPGWEIAGMWLSPALVAAAAAAATEPSTPAASAGIPPTPAQRPGSRRFRPAPGNHCDRETRAPGRERWAS